MKEKKDIHEKDFGYQKKVRKEFIELCGKERNWIKIDCVEGNKLKTKNEISEMLWKHVKKQTK